MTTADRDGAPADDQTLREGDQTLADADQTQDDTDQTAADYAKAKAIRQRTSISSVLVVEGVS